MGNAEQMLSRDFWRLATQFDPMRQFSLFYSSTGHFLNQVIVMCALFIQLYIMCFLVFSGIQQALDIDEDESADQPATPASEQVRRLYVTFFGVNVFQVSALQLIASGVNLVVEYGPVRRIDPRGAVVPRKLPLLRLVAAAKAGRTQQHRVQAGRL